MGTEVNRLGASPSRWHAGALLVLALLVTYWVAGMRLPQLLDAQVHDQLTRVGAQTQPPAELVFVDIDEASLAQLGPWPWPRTVMADLARRLREEGARAQVWDLYFPEPARGDELFLDTLKPQGASASDIVFGQVLVLDPQVQSPPRQGTLRSSASAPEVCSDIGPPLGHFGVVETWPDVKVGHISATPELDGGLRRLPAVICHNGQRYPQLALVAAELLEPAASWALAEGPSLTGPSTWLRRGSLRFALDAQGYMPVPYRLHHARWPAVSAVQVLEGRGLDATAGGVSLKGKVVLVGATALGLADAVSTPFHAHAPGVSVHAELLASAMSGAWPVSPAHPALPAVLWVMLGGALLVAPLARLQRPSVLVVACAGTALVPLGLAVLARWGGVVWPVAAPTAGLALFGFGLGALQAHAAWRQAGVLSRHLESFLPRDLAREIARQHPSGDSLGRPETGAVVALRVVGLERWSANVDSLKALGLVHGVCSLAERHARQQGGTLEHLQGDTLLLAWPGRLQGAPQRLGADAAAADLKQPVQQAIIATRSLFVELAALLASAETERQPLGLRAAIEAGPYLLAVAGSHQSRRSLMLGPAVDRSLALLTMCDELASPLLMGQQAAQTDPHCAMHPMGHFLLPDSGQPQPVFRVEP